MTGKPNAHRPGSLVRARGRTWVIQPESNEELLVIRPLGGRAEEAAAVYLPLGFDAGLEQTEFPLPGIEDLGNLAHGRILFDAARLSLRETCGPFRCFGKLAFRPRAYQLVPLVMALRQPDPIRLLIADDVGIGKTIEALLIVKELLERGDVKRLAVLCPPHLCDQWREELAGKFGIDAVVIRSSTFRSLDSRIPDNRSVFQYYPFQIVSVDFIKGEKWRRTFVAHCPELVVLDEAHACARPAGAHESQQLRYTLVSSLLKDSRRHLVMLTATPHSGKDAEFSSLLGLLDPAFEGWDLMTIGEAQRKELAKRFIQRRRANIERWMGEETPFPNRPATSEIAYTLSPAYRGVFEEVLSFTKELTTERGMDSRRQRLRYWTALALLRGVMSSPESGIEMLRRRLAGSVFSEDASMPEYGEADHPVFEAEEEMGSDWTQGHLIEEARLEKAEANRLKAIIESMESLRDLEEDRKAIAAAGLLRSWLAAGYRPVVFCRFIATADYLAERLKTLLGSGVFIQSVTSESPDDERRTRVEEFRNHEARVLVATDCLSEGINLQDLFTAVLHYDLPWNPNRLEQREGRVDRFGQSAPEVRTALLWGEDNPIDSVVLRVLLRKVAAIRDALGISIPFPEDSRPLLDAVFGEVMSEAERIKRDWDRGQLDLFWDADDLVRQQEAAVEAALETAKKRAQAIHTIFAHASIRAEDLEHDLKAADEAAGSPEDVERFVVESVRSLHGGSIEKTPKGWRLDTDTLSETLRRSLFPGVDGASAAEKLLLTFRAPTPERYRYLGRIHGFVSSLCEEVLSRSLDGRKERRVSRAAVVATSSVARRTVVLLVRARNLILERKEGRQVVTEELLLWGWRGLAKSGELLAPLEAEALVLRSVPNRSLSEESAAHFLGEALGELETVRRSLDALALERARTLVKQHERYKSLTGGAGRFEAVEPALPPDVVGVYVFVPE